MGRLDHVHIRVPDRAAALDWYRDQLGFEPVVAYDFWAHGFDGGPLQISADGGHTMLALFEASDSHPMRTDAIDQGIAFNVDADSFVEFARSLPGEIPAIDGARLQPGDLIDFDLCWAYEFSDPWGNRFELNCYDYDRIEHDLVLTDGLRPHRMWPVGLYADYRAAHTER